MDQFQISCLFIILAFICILLGMIGSRLDAILKELRKARKAK